MVSGIRLPRFALAAVLSILAAGQGCTFPEVEIEPGAKHLVVHAVLDLGAREQTVLLTYSHSSGGFTQAVNGALVTITTPDGVQMIAVQDTQSQIYRVSLETYLVTLQPGGTYSLHVHTPSGEDATGTTTIPLASPVSLKVQSAPFTKSQDTLRLEWNPVAGAASYEVRIASVYSSFDSVTFMFSRYTTFSTRPVILAGTAQAPLEDGDIFWEGSKMLALVSAVDVNYYEYYRVLSDPFLGAAPSRLAGAVGVFGSMVPLVARRLDVR